MTENNNKSPFEVVDTRGMTPEMKKKLADPNFKMEKSAEEKEYLVVFKSYLCVLSSEITTGMEGLSEGSYELYSERGITPHSYSEKSLTIDGEAITGVGRRNIFDQIRDFIQFDGHDQIDYDESFVLVEGVPFEKRVSLRRFVELCCQKYNEEVDLSRWNDDNSTQPQATGNGYNTSSLMGTN